MYVSQDHIRNLLAIFVKHGLRGKIGIHRLHKHDDILEEQVKLETKLTSKPGKWIKPVSINSLDLDNIHPVVFKNVFKLVAGGICLHLDPYEFREGPSPVSVCDLDDSKYIEEVADYITRNNLANVIALEFLDSLKDVQQPQEPTAEVEVGKHGTIVLPKSMMIGGKLIPTGWPDINQPYDPDGDPFQGSIRMRPKSRTVR